MKSVEALMHEHRVIEHGLAVLEAVADRIEQGALMPTDKVTALLEFFRVFADQCHHGKEEGMFFPELEAKGIPKEGGPIGVMLIEHEEGRELRRRMIEAASNFADEANRQQFVTAARKYINLLRQHIWKEDNVLFKMAEQVLTEAEDEQLAEGFEHHERERIGEGVHERYHHLVHELEAEFRATHN
jgi:hemerythrin-like domain-containing protein